MSNHYHAVVHDRSGRDRSLASQPRSGSLQMLSTKKQEPPSNHRYDGRATVSSDRDKPSPSSFGLAPPGGSYGAAFDPDRRYIAPGGRYSDAFAEAGKIGKLTIGAAALRLAMLPTWDHVRHAVPRLPSPILNQLFQVGESVVQLIAMTLALAWVFRVTEAIRATQGRTAYSPAMAVAFGLIPVVSFVMPTFVLRDVWHRIMGNDYRGWLIVPFGISLAVATPTALLFWSLNNGVLRERQSWYGAISVLGNVNSVALAVLWVCLSLLIGWITRATSA